MSTARSVVVTLTAPPLRRCQDHRGIWSTTKDSQAGVWLLAVGS
jgi:hypothetical protein